MEFRGSSNSSHSSTELSACSSSFPPWSFSASEFDQPFTEQQLQAIEAIEAAYQSTSAKKRRPNSTPDGNEVSCVSPDTGRRLPRSIFSHQSPRFSPLSPCRGVPPGKAAVMQLCLENSECHVMHIIHSGIPQSLQALLEDDTLSKAGVGIASDASKVFKEYNVSVKPLNEISDLANQKLAGVPKKWGLRALTETLISKELQKPDRIRLGNWEVAVLSKDQLQYAATDAFASWYLHEILKGFPHVEKVADSEPIA
ncbi:Werner Syndrome-like exonuclease isoform X4 [Cucumis sativus]|uniref:Werner Syndrome-like exonuclease isoform X4 n=1 Tax=Cucumis sativus TaxID=3659 RepID=UPI0012F4F252|nr:Werner Syndrome-like exonuclease isoform X4 [Cucumis sativus]